MQSLSPKKPWYKTKLCFFFLLILGLVCLAFLWFAGTVGYYTWKISRGEGAELDAIFRGPQFTFDASLSNADAQALTDVNTIIGPHTPILGSPEAPVTIVTFIDFECPFCQSAFPVFDSMLETYQPVVRVVFKHFPLAAIHPLAAQAAEAAACMNEQGQFWPYYKTLFEQRVLSMGSLTQYAEDLGVERSRFESCMRSDVWLPALERDLADGVDLGVRGTPTYFVNGVKVEGSITREQWDTIILGILEQQ